MQKCACKVMTIPPLFPVPWYFDCVQSFSQLLSSRTKIVALSHVSNVLGSVLDTDFVCEQAHGVGAKVRSYDNACCVMTSSLAIHHTKEQSEVMCLG